MSHRIYSTLNTLRAAIIAILFLCSASTASSSQDVAPVNPPAAAGGEKAEQILQRAVEAVGGRTFLDVRTVVGRGFFTQYQDGMSGVPTTFVDYLVFPDRERTEFRSGKVKSIQTNVGNIGWIYDGANGSLKDLKPAQTDDFRIAMRTSIDNILRGWWRKEKAVLTYVGKREAGLGRRNETVRLQYEDGFAVEFEFAAKEGLPAKAIYKRQNAEGAEVIEEDRFARFLTIAGVNMPSVIDHFRAGIQTSRINYESVEYNRSIPDSLFARPADVKALK